MNASIRKVGQEVLPRLEPLWLSLHRHHAEVAPHLGAIRTPADSWETRRGDYKAWLVAGDSFVVVAEVETLCVLPDYRGQGLGERLLELVYTELMLCGVRQVSLQVIASNAGAVRFYSEQGFEPTLVSMRRELK